MEEINTIVGGTNTGVLSEGILSRAALGGGALLIACATGYMNIAGWVAQANDETGAWVNGTLATGMELGAAGSLAWAAYQLGQRRPLRAVFAGAVGGMLVYFNTMAAQNFIHVQHTQGAEQASEAALTVEDSAGEIARLERELLAIEQRNGGALPRPIAALDAAATGLNIERRRDAAVLRRLGEERALRTAYDDAQADIAELRADMRGGRIEAQREVRVVMNADQIVPFIWAMEILKGSIFFILGTSDLGAIFRRRAVENDTPPVKAKPKQSAEERAKWARIKGRRAPA